ncbi:MAG: hypothetical protein ACQESR_07430, partial [Planctomycetota bacterium]
MASATLTPDTYAAQPLDGSGSSGAWVYKTINMAGYGPMNLWQSLNPTWLLAGGLCVLAISALVFWRWLRRRRTSPQRVTSELFIDLSRLDATGPPAEGPRLEFYGTPVRLAVVVVAPGGRGGELPPSDVLPGIMERLVPGMSNVIAKHHPMIRRWPEQLSSHGFAQAFFNQIPLPGTRGKGTPWCGLAGKLTIGDRFFLVGLVCRAHASN